MLLFPFEYCLVPKWMSFVFSGIFMLAISLQKCFSIWWPSESFLFKKLNPFACQQIRVVCQSLCFVLVLSKFFYYREFHTYIEIEEYMKSQVVFRKLQHHPFYHIYTSSTTLPSRLLWSTYRMSYSFIHKHFNMHL